MTTAIRLLTWGMPLAIVVAPIVAAVACRSVRAGGRVLFFEISVISMIGLIGSIGCLIAVLVSPGGSGPEVNFSGVIVGFMSVVASVCAAALIGWFFVFRWWRGRRQTDGATTEGDENRGTCDELPAFLTFEAKQEVRLDVCRVSGQPLIPDSINRYADE